MLTKQLPKLIAEVSQQTDSARCLAVDLLDILGCLDPIRKPDTGKT